MATEAQPNLAEEAGLHVVVDEEHGSLSVEGCSMDGPETTEETKPSKVASVTTKDTASQKSEKETAPKEPSGTPAK